MQTPHSSRPRPAHPHFSSASTAGIKIIALTTFPIFAQACSPVRWFDLLLLVDITLHSTVRSYEAVDEARDQHCAALLAWASRPGCCKGRDLVFPSKYADKLFSKPLIFRFERSIKCAPSNTSGRGPRWFHAGVCSRNNLGVTYIERAEAGRGANTTARALYSVIYLHNKPTT